MKICTYCKTDNRDEAIFCQSCRHALPTMPRPPRIAFVWIFMLIGLVGLAVYLFAAPSFVAPTSFDRSSAGAIPARKPVTLLSCIDEFTSIRRGPGTQYETVGTLPSGTCLTVVGRNADADWAFMVSDDDLTGWVTAAVLKDISDLSRVSVRDDFPQVYAGRPTLTSTEIADGAQVYLTQVAATNHPQSPLGHYIEPCFEAVNRVGDQITCRMEKAYCDYFPDLEGSPTICTDRPAPDQIFELVRPEMDWTRYDEQCLIVSGYMEVNGGMLQIEALHRDQVSICD